MDPELLAQTSGSDYLFAFGWAALLAISILFWKVGRQEKQALLVAWGAKVVVTLGVMLLYEAYYEALDSYWYFMTGRLQTMSLSDFEFGNGTGALLLFSTLHSALLPVSFHAQKVTCAYVGLIAVYQFYVAARLTWPGSSIRTLYVLAFFPSILFWTSILGKDPFVLLGIALFVRGVVTWYRETRASAVMYVIAGAVLASSVRPWLGAILVAPLFVFVLARTKRVWTRFLFVFVFVVGGVAAYRLLLSHIQLADAADVIDYSNQASHAWGVGGSGQQLDVQFTGFGDMLAFAPLGMFTALLRPLPGEFFTPFALVASLENGVLIALLVRAMRRGRRADLRDPLIAWGVAFVLIWAAVYGFVSYQNLGTAVRFRLQILPVFLGLLLFLGRKDDRGWKLAEEVPERKEPAPRRRLRSRRVDPLPLAAMTAGSRRVGSKT